jgi:transposase
VDGLKDHGYPVKLANPARMDQYTGLKQTDDQTDAFWIAEMLRLRILPVGYVYPREDRAVRDLLRRRLQLVRQRTAQVLSFQALVSRETGSQIGMNDVRKLTGEDVYQFTQDPNVALMGQTHLSVIRFLGEKIRELEATVFKQVKLKPEYEKLLTVPGIGKVLALTIMLGTGPISRFRTAGDYSSYSRCVRSVRQSNAKKKGENNRKNGNKYLAWAYVEAANFIRRYSPEAKRWHQRKLARSNAVVATKALASKLSKACYFIMRDQVEFELKKVFG